MVKGSGWRVVFLRRGQTNERERIGGFETDHVGVNVKDSVLGFRFSQILDSGFGILNPKNEDSLHPWWNDACPVYSVCFFSRYLISLCCWWKKLFVLTEPLFFPRPPPPTSAEVPRACHLQGAAPHAEEGRASAPHAEEGSLQSQVELLIHLILGRPATLGLGERWGDHKQVVTPVVMTMTCWTISCEDIHASTCIASYTSICKYAKGVETLDIQNCMNFLTCQAENLALALAIPFLLHGSHVFWGHGELTIHVWWRKH